MVHNIGCNAIADRLYSRLVPNSSYCMKCLDHADALHLNTVVYVVAKGWRVAAGAIIFACLFLSSRYLTHSYLFCLDSLHSLAIAWIGKPAYKRF